MAVKYCVFWIPTMYHHEGVQIPIKKEISDDISDDANNRHHVTVTLTDQYDIIVKNEREEITLKYEDRCNNGLYLYSFDIENENSFLKNEIPNAIYHLIKGFYHTHEFHNNTTDSLLRAYLSASHVNINSKNNEAITHYLKLYEEKFKAYSQQITALCNRLTHNSSIRGSKHEILENHKLLQEICNNALGEALYCNTLLSSKYVDFELKENDYNNEQRKLIINIKNAIENIKLVENKNQSEFNYRNTKIAYKNNTSSFWLTAIGIILSAISIFLAVKSFQTPAFVNDLKKGQNTTQQKLEMNFNKMSDVEKILKIRIKK